jgi:hypothetical protein
MFRRQSFLVLGITLALSTACDRQPTEPSVGSGAQSASSGPENLPLAAVAMGKHVSRYTSDGDFASVFSSDGATYLFLTVSRYTDRISSGTTLYYDLYQCSEIECRDIEAGFGSIPDGDLKVTGTGHTTLRTNTAGAGFSRWSGAGGDIAVEWEPKRDFEYSTKGTTDARYGEIRYRSSGTTTYRSASLSGTVIGHAVSGSLYSDGQVGSSKSKTVEIGAP